jgi:hypothetical protein
MNALTKDPTLRDIAAFAAAQKLGGDTTVAKLLLDYKKAYRATQPPYVPEVVTLTSAVLQQVLAEYTEDGCPYRLESERITDVDREKGIEETSAVIRRETDGKRFAVDFYRNRDYVWFDDYPADDDELVQLTSIKPRD